MRGGDLQAAGGGYFVGAAAATSSQSLQCLDGMVQSLNCVLGLPELALENGNQGRGCHLWSVTHRVGKPRSLATKGGVRTTSDTQGGKHSTVTNCLGPSGSDFPLQIANLLFALLESAHFLACERGKGLPRQHLDLLVENIQQFRSKRKCSFSFHRTTL